MGDGGAADDGRIRAVSRALAVLRLMNTAQRWTIHELHQRLDLPKSTLFRVLATLQGDGYVQADVARGQYTLTGKVRELGGGYTEQAQIVAAGTPVAVRVTRSIKWPLAIGVRDGNALVIGCSTMPYSPLAVHATTIGHRLNLAGSAMGLAYLACCSEAERAILLDWLVETRAPGDTTTAVDLRARIDLVARQGYAVRQPDRNSDSATLAVPILAAGQSIAALGMTTFGDIMNRRTVAHYLPILRDTAAEIAAAVAVAGEASAASGASGAPVSATQAASSGTGTR